MDFSNTSRTSRIVDPHSFSNPTEADIQHVDWVLEVDFNVRQIKGYGLYSITHKEAQEVILDVNQLEIIKVVSADGITEIPFTLSVPQPYLGQALHIPLAPKQEQIIIYFATTAGSAALQWLSPEQTAGKQLPFLFTQSQAVLARTWLPCQDSPAVRFTYTADVTVPSHLLPVMSAANPQIRNTDGRYLFCMEQPIPSYLLSLAVGNLVFFPLGKRTGVYAEPETLEKAMYEFAVTEKMLEAAEDLYGPYLWDRYDLLVLPPSFPFGGMENPKLTFATPTVLAGDRSLTSLIAHELAHSWSGNLVTNATWNDFWLNEGFTVYFERRIMERLLGPAYAEMLHTLGYQDLQQTVNALSTTPQDTCLKLALEKRNPDEGLTEIAYEKGNCFIRHLEVVVGREKLDAFIKLYFSTFQFQSMDTECFIHFLNRELIGEDAELKLKIGAEQWIYQPGLPDFVLPPNSSLFQLVEAANLKWKNGVPASQLDTDLWSSHQWVYFLRSFPHEMTTLQLKELDAAFQFTSSGNAEILAEWFLISIRNQYKPAFAKLEEFLIMVGRRKFIFPLYQALLEVPGGKEMALSIYERARLNYHSVAFSSIDQLLNLNPKRR